MARRVIITPWFNQSATGGGAIFSVNVARVWLAQGHDVHILCSDHPRTLTDLEAWLGKGRLHLHQVSHAARLHLPHAFDNDVAGAAGRALRTIAPESIHVHNFQGLLGAVRAAIESGAPTVYLAHDFGLVCLSWYLYNGSLTPCTGPTPLKCRPCLSRTHALSFQAKLAARLPSSLVRWARPGTEPEYYRHLQEARWWYQDVESHLGGIMGLLKEFDAVVAPSPVMAQVLLQHGAPPVRLHRVACGVSRWKGLQHRPEAPDPAAPLRLAFFGHRGQVKGLSIVIDALTGLPDGLALSVTAYGGHDSVVSAPESARRYLQAGPQLAGEAIGRELAHTDGMLVPSLWHENAPSAVLESLASGTPVIAAKQAGMTHLLQDGVNGLLVPPGQVAAWRQVLLRVARDPGILRRMRPQCRYDKTVEDFCDDLEVVITAARQEHRAAREAGGQMRADVEAAQAGGR